MASTVLFIVMVTIVIILMLVASTTAAIGAADIYSSTTYDTNENARSAHKWLAVAAALISAARDIPLPNNCAVMGELGLSGEVRMVSGIDIRLKEAAKLGFENIIVPQGIEKLKSWKNIKSNLQNINIHTVSHIRDLARFFKK